MIKEKLVSIILPVYNADKYLHECIESLLKQTHSRLELVIINDGSTDKSEDVILSFEDPRIIYFRNESNLKLIRTLNLGLTLASGEFIARMDADDIAMPYRIEEQLKYMVSTNYDLCSSNINFVSLNGKFHSFKKFYCTLPSSVKFYAFFENPLVHPGVMFHRRLLIDYKYIDESEAFAIEDYYLWINLLRKGYSFGVVPKSLLKYRLNPSGESFIHRQTQKNNHIQLGYSYLKEQLKLPDNIELYKVITLMEDKLITLWQLKEAYSYLMLVKSNYAKQNSLGKLEAVEIEKWCQIRFIEMVILFIKNGNKKELIKGVVFGLKKSKCVFKGYVFFYFINRLFWLINTYPFRK